MISKTTRPIEVLALLLCATTASAQADPARVEHCLRQSKSDLSDACRSIFEQRAGPVASRSK
jgi:hypothetical protein